MINKKYLLSIPVILLLLCGCEKNSVENKNETIQANSEILHIDLDGDNKEESLSFKTTENSIVLNVNDQSISIPLKGDLTEQSPQSVYEEPLIHLLSDKQGTKMLLLSVVWNTNKIGTKTDLWLYKYQNNTLVETWNAAESDSNKEGIDYKVSNYNNGYVTLEIPQFSIITQISIDKDYYEKYLNTHLEGKLDEVSNIMYYINDYNNDQIPEVIIEKVISTGATEWLPFTRVFDIFTINNGSLNLIKVIPNENSYKDILSEVISHLE